MEGLSGQASEVSSHLEVKQRTVNTERNLKSETEGKPEEYVLQQLREKAASRRR